MNLPRKLRRMGPAAVLALAVLVGTVHAADHLDAPGLTSPGNDGRLDINDVYVFQSPADPASTVLIMTVNPLAGNPGATTFHPDATYAFLIDGDGDAKRDLALRIDFGVPDVNGAQRLKLRCTPATSCPSGAVLASGTTGQDVALATGGTLRADRFDDPFFFDLGAFLGSYPFCEAPGGAPGNSGDDFFAGRDVSAIVLELPSAVLGHDSIGVWATTQLDDQVDRMGRPAINTVFIPSDFKNAFNDGKPRNDARDFDAFLGSFSGLLLPDILTVDTSSAAGFLNGRRLDDDVIDTELALVGVPPGSDCVDANDVDFLDVFPYLAASHSN